ncbi:MAG: hypothetical protein WDW38_007345 [Sanguina aurantia]
MAIGHSIMGPLLLLGLLGLASTVAGIMPGGVSSKDGHSEGVRQASIFAVQSLNSDTTNGLRNGLAGLQGHLTLEGVETASSQVVAGTVYRMTLKVSDATGAVHDVHVKVWSRPWLEDNANSEKAKTAWILSEASLV